LTIDGHILHSYGVHMKLLALVPSSYSSAQQHGRLAIRNQLQTSHIPLEVRSLSSTI